MKDFIKRLLRENLEGINGLPVELRGKRVERNIIGRYRECVLGVVNLSELGLYPNAIKTAEDKLSSDNKFKVSKDPIVVGVDINSGGKQLLDGYHRYLFNRDKDVVSMKAFFIPMRDNEIIDYNEI